MSLLDWVSGSAARVRADGLAGAVESGREFRLGVGRQLAKRSYDPELIWERDWDLLVVLDACRLDLMEEVAPDYDFLEPVGSFESTGSSTREWLDANFTDAHAEEIGSTAYVRANPQELPLPGAAFAALDDVWTYAWDNEVGSIWPEDVTDRAVRMGRSDAEFSRAIVHYMQPHMPFLNHPELGGGERIAEGGDTRERTREIVWDRLRDGELDYETVWSAYRDNLECVLDSVAVLLENFDAETAVVTADHGNALGEFGAYGHRQDTPLPCLVEVPWSETTATDSGEYEPALEAPESATVSEDEVASRLRALGYR
jgi:hypothetical protein